MLHSGKELRDKSGYAEYTIEDIEPGLIRSFKVLVTEEMSDQFARLSGDYNPLHVDEEYAKKTVFNRRICHGSMLLSFFSRMMGMYLPGKNALCLSLNVNFLSPAYINDEIKVEGTVMKKSLSTGIIHLKVAITNQYDLQLVNGEAKVLIRK